MEHTVQAYIERRSAAELLHFLEICMQLHQWEQYADIIPHIFTILENRSAPVPEQVRSSWINFISATQAAIKG